MADERALDMIHEIRGENPEYKVMTSLLAEGDTFVDVGANFGTFSLLAARIVGRSGKVIAIEPQPALTRLISESMRLSAVANCEVLQNACGLSSGTSEILIPENDSGRAGLFPAFSARTGHDTLAVEVLSLDDILTSINHPGKTLIKIDVEGSELDVIGGAQRFLAERRPAILIELNPWSAAAAGTSTGQIVATLQGLGYTTFADAASFPATLQVSAIPADRQINLVALP
jgi:FkbM family methyltransferase